MVTSIEMSVAALHKQIAPIHPECEASIIVPARDEAPSIEAALSQLLEAQVAANERLAATSFEVILLANNCFDETAHLARRVADRLQNAALHVIEVDLPAGEANVGAARKLLMDLAADRLCHNLARFPSAAILSTDADSMVANDWISANLRALQKGADIVGGRITLTRESLKDLPPRARRRHLQDTAYRFLVSWLEHWLDPLAHDPWPRHYQHFGASLGVTAEAYRRLGGLPACQHLEDIAFINKAKRGDARIRHSMDVRVQTIGRLQGRVKCGLSSQLTEWSDREECMVDSPKWLWQYFRLRGLVRAALRERDDAMLRDTSPPANIMELAATCQGIDDVSDNAGIAEFVTQSCPRHATLEGALVELREIYRSYGDKQPQDPPALKSKIFPSFFMAGFECSTHRNSRGIRLDLIAATRHENNARQNYHRLRDLGIRGARDGFRWHLIDRFGSFDFESAKAQIDASLEANVRVFWDLCHYGWPDDVFPTCGSFIERFTRYALACAEFLVRRGVEAPCICPVNELSFLTWAIGKQHMHPYLSDRDREIKVELAKATIAAIDAIRSVAPAARFLTSEPIINPVPWPTDSNAQRTTAAAIIESQFEAWDLLCGKLPDAGGTPAHLDIVGANFYPYCQWREHEDGLRETIGRGDNLWKPLHEMLTGLKERYERPLILAETSAEGDSRADWLEYIVDEVQRCNRSQSVVQAVCLYPIIDRPDWEQCDRWHRSGVWDLEIADDGKWKWVACAPYANKIRQASRMLRKGLQ